jgi:hypothetical protein
MKARRGKRIGGGDQMLNKASRDARRIARLSLSPPLPCSAADAAQEVVYWAKAVLTALNTGNIEKGSLLHHKLREVVIRHRDAAERETPNIAISKPWH